MVIEIVLRAGFFIYFEKNPLPWDLCTVKGVPYVQGGYHIDDPAMYVYLKKTKPRILVLGDYISMHRGREPGGRDYPELLAEKLNGAFEVINTGAVYYSVKEEAAVLEHMGDRVDPDVIVVGHVFNDLGFRGIRYAMMRLQLKASLFKFQWITPLALMNLNLFVKQRYWSQAYSQHAQDIIKESWQDYNDPGSIVFLRQFLGALKRIQERRKTPVIFVIIPIFYDFNNAMVKGINNRVVQECERSGIEYIDLLDIFKQYKVMDLKEDDGDVWHPNAAGRMLIAEQIFKRIKAISLAQH
ncbi:MAG: SGNH/GDSL hydrolase family protein [Candidatus Omnitrophica bacterium]|nr:SGNH/GDSL hydrolase family protein [Candidatus Omnitrophota bacterium]